MTRHISGKVKAFVFERDKGKCVYCGSSENLEFDHIIPISKGGSNTEKNIQLTCMKCIRTKREYIDDSFLSNPNYIPIDKYNNFIRGQISNNQSYWSNNDFLKIHKKPTKKGKNFYFNIPIHLFREGGSLSK